MSLRITCPHCSAAYAGGPHLQGRRVKCPRCGGVVQVPKASAATEVSDPTQRMRSSRQKRREASGSAAVADPPAPATTAVPPGKHQPPHPHVVHETVMPSALEHPDDDDPESVGFGNKDKVDHSEMDMTPMVDVTFLLLIFFMVTASFTLQKSMEVPKSKKDEPTVNPVEEVDEEVEAVTVIVDSYNTFTVECSDWVRESPSEQELLINLREARQGGRSGVVPNKLMVKAHVDATHQKVIAALDAGADVGMEQLQLTYIEEDL